MALTKLTHAARAAYVEAEKSGLPRDIDEGVFNRGASVEAVAQIDFDSYSHTAGTLQVKQSGQPAATKLIQAGQRMQLAPPVLAKQVAIDSELRDASVVGTDPTNAQANINARANMIINGSDGFLQETRNTICKITIDMLRSGKFSIDTFEYDFGRKGANSFNHSLQNSSFDAAVAKGVGELQKNNCPKAGNVVLLGNNWLERFDSEKSVVDKRKATNTNAFTQDGAPVGLPAALRGIEGLDYVSRYRVDGVAIPVWIFVYQPAQSPDGNPYIPDNQLLIFNVNSGGYRFYRGVDVVDANGVQRRAVGGAVIDSYKDDATIMEYIRVQTRYFAIPTNINHTVAITGSNF